MSFEICSMIMELPFSNLSDIDFLQLHTNVDFNNSMFNLDTVLRDRDIGYSLSTKMILVITPLQIL